VLPALLLAGLLQTATSPPTPTPAPIAPIAPAAFDAQAAVVQALHRLDEAQNDAHRFTYLQQLRIVTHSPDGLHAIQTMRSYEATWINDLLYLRLLGIDGKPLAGKDLADEQKRYDAALKKKRDLADKNRAHADGFTTSPVDFDLDALLTPAYMFAQISSTAAEDDTVHLVEATLIPKAKHPSKCPWSVRLWLSEKQGILLRYGAFIPDSTPLGKCSGELEEAKYALVDNQPEPTISALRFNVSFGPGFYTVDNYTIFTNYRRFTTSITLKPGTVVDEPPPDATPPPK
jgi:hypothetical protein